MPPLPASYERARQALDWIGATAPSRACLARRRSQGSCVPLSGEGELSRSAATPSHAPPAAVPPSAATARLGGSKPRFSDPPASRPPATFPPIGTAITASPRNQPARSELDAQPADRRPGACPDAGRRPRRRCGRGGRKRRTQTRPCHAASCTIKMCERMARAVNIGRMRTPTR